MSSRKKTSAMKVNKKQLGSKGLGKARGTTGRKLLVQSRASRNVNPLVAVAANYAQGNSGRAPKVMMSKDSCRVVHRELIANLGGGASTAFTVNSTFALNPGLSATFPWLSNMAQNWEAYRFNTLRFCYFTRTGSTTVGSVIMAPDYDPADPAPINEQTASSFEDVQEDAPWKNIVCSLRSGAMHAVGPRKFVRSGALPGNQDIKLFDVGNLFLCSVDSNGAAAWGKIWVEYDVTFHTPQLPSAGSAFTKIALGQASWLVAQSQVFGSVALGFPLITGSLDVSAVLNTLTLNERSLIVGAEYELVVTITGTGITVGMAISSSPGLTVKNTLFTGFPAAGTTDALVVTFTATGVSGSVVLTVTATTITASQFTFALVPTSGL